MKRIAILGCENSHADMFLGFIKDTHEYSDVEVVGVYSHEPEAARTLSEKHGVKVLENYADAVGKIDGLVVTARHGDNHYKYAAPYIESGIPMFIDKPITINEDEAVEFMRRTRTAGVKICGGSSLKHTDEIRALRAEVLEGVDGETVGGIVRAPIATASEHGGFYFYAQHLCEMVLEPFGRYPRSVIATTSGPTHNVIFRYEGFDVLGTYCNDSGAYFAARFTKGGTSGGAIAFGECFRREFREFYDLLSGGEQNISYEDFISPVFVMNAICRSFESGKEEMVKEFSL